jgi:hypothetical protein
MSGLDIRNNRIMVDVACNDPDNGSFAGRAAMIQIGDLLELEAKREPAPKIVELAGAIRFSGKAWPIHGSKDWVGNWCWNGYWMDIPVAVEFLTWLHGRDLYSVSSGETRLFNRWRWREPFDREQKQFMDRIFGKPSMWDAA